MVNLPETAAQAAASLFQQFADDEKALLMAAGRLTAGRIADVGKSLEELKAESLVRIQIERVRKEAQQRAAAHLAAAVLKGTQAALAEHARVQPAPAPRKPVEPVPVVTVGASDGVEPGSTGPGWSLKPMQRAPGYRWPLYQVLKEAHKAGKHCPKARDILEAWKLNLPAEVQVMPDGVKYNDGLGNPKEANLKAIQQAIKGLLKS